MTRKIGTITFHAAYNYGSCLQAYALQEYIKKLFNNNCTYSIINLRTENQKNIYKTFFQKKGLKNRVKSFLLLKEKKKITNREKNFENFIRKYLQITKEYNSDIELKKENFEFDYYIAGSDQLWNVQALDFNWSNYLEFVQSKNKISYAASFGGKLIQNWEPKDILRVKNNLAKFKNISVRETENCNYIKQLTGMEAMVNIDPTMLLTKEEWKEIIPKNPINKSDYIYLYNLKKDKNIIKLAKKISKIMKMPIVVSQYGFNGENSKEFIKQYDAGPLEFLNLINGAKLVLSSSFHGNVFAILLNKPFFAIKGMTDLRINTLLKKLDLEDRSISFENYKEKCKDIYNVDFGKSDNLIEIERNKAKEYLKNALDIK